MSYVAFYNNTTTPSLRTVLEDLADHKNKLSVVSNILDKSPFPTFIQLMKLDASVIDVQCTNEFIERVFTLSRLLLYRMGIFLHNDGEMSVVEDGTEGIMIYHKDYSMEKIERGFLLLTDIVTNLFYIGACRIAVGVSNLCFKLKNQLVKNNKIRSTSHPFETFRQNILEAYKMKYDVGKKHFFPEPEYFQEMLDFEPLPANEVCIHRLITYNDNQGTGHCLFNKSNKLKHLACRV